MSYIKNTLPGKFRCSEILFGALVLLTGALLILFTSPLFFSAASANADPSQDKISLAEWNMININCADAEELCLLKGIGEKKAQKIVEYRNVHGLFQSIDEMAEIDGITQKMVDSWKGLVTLD